MNPGIVENVGALIIFPFNSLSSNKKFLSCCTSTDNNIIQWEDLENDLASSLSLKP